MSEAMSLMSYKLALDMQHIHCVMSNRWSALASSVSRYLAQRNIQHDRARMVNSTNSALALVKSTRLNCSKLLLRRAFETDFVAASLEFPQRQHCPRRCMSGIA
jgi:hypothetical protein